jgi:hypothetical protein
MTICMLVLGVITLILFGIHKKFFTPKIFLPIALLSNRTVLGSSIYGTLAFVSFSIWNSFFYSLLIAVNNLPISNAVLIRNIYTLGSCSWAIIVGLLVSFSGRYRWLAPYFGHLACRTSNVFPKHSFFLIMSVISWIQFER